MSILSRLKVGERLNVERYEGNINMDKKSMLNAQLIDLTKNYAYISVPAYRGQRYPLYRGQKISISYYRDAGEYQFYGEVIKETDNNILAYAIRPISELSKIQRRNYYRLPIAINVYIEKKQASGRGKIECITKDISGGGIRAVCDENIEEGQGVRIELFLDEDDKDFGITIDGVVVRNIRDRVTNSYELGIMFEKITQANEDKIHAFIFEKQRLLRKKGLI